MRALALTQSGATPELIDLDIPEPADGEVRVRVRAASVNGFDLSVAAGYLEGMMEHRFPVVLGKDFAGTVDAVGAGVDGYAVGDRVFGVVTKPYLGDGSFAEYVTVPTSVGIAHLPDDIDDVHGAALGLAGAAALQVVDAAELQAGQTVLVVGATGGVGNQAVQLAVHAGCEVIATAGTPEEQELVGTLGATTSVDYRGDVAAAVREQQPDGVDAVIHLAGDPTAVVSLVKPGGRFASTMLGSPDEVPVDDVTVVGIYADPTPQTLTRAASLHVEGVTDVRVQETHPLEDAPAALEAFTAGTRGKVVVTV